MICQAYKKAKECGDQFYFTNNSCRKGHLCERYTSTRKCIDCDSIDRKQRYCTNKEYYTTRYQENKEHILQLGKEWKNKNHEDVKEDNKRYYREHKQKISNYHKEHYLEVREFRLQEYRNWKTETIDTIFNFYKSIKLEWVNDSNQLEDKFRNYVAWKIVNSLNLKVQNEYMLGARANGFVDIFIPGLKIGIEVKLDHKSWTNSKILKQRTKYEKVLGSGNVLFVSPNGSFEYTIETLLSQLKNLHEKQQEHLTLMLF